MDDDQAAFLNEGLPPSWKFKLLELYWRSYSNVIDLVVVCLCVIVMITTVLPGWCTQGTTILDTVLLVLRNVVQSTTIDFADTRTPSIDFDDDISGVTIGPVATGVRRSVNPQVPTPGNGIWPSAGAGYKVLA
ncbi:MAG: hypothetical protein BJ554DRAFT_481 [Olpidium bornovanus]|uniref:Uncharacterized protein n=1 Tax=Olpidium bornovanus TaxID=278681 RepID=A0A8H7ZU09_9FUNG|nr:MAG: hypothetical protein BJ554DRAFT_481 [Olpidium bornovanus]